MAAGRQDSLGRQRILLLSGKLKLTLQLLGILPLRSCLLREGRVISVSLDSQSVFLCKTGRHLRVKGLI